MKVEIKIDESAVEPQVIIVTNKLTEEISSLAKSLGGAKAPVLMGFKGDVAEILDETDIYRVYSSDGKVYAETGHGEYTLRLRLYELEERLSSKFVRISNSEIVNLKKVKSFNMSFTGTIMVRLKNGKNTYISRRYVTKVKQVLGI